MALDLSKPIDWAARNSELAEAARRVADAEAAANRSQTGSANVIGKTAQARDRIRVGGHPWRIVKVQDRVAFSSDAGPWTLLESPSPVNANGPEMAWAHATSRDADYRCA